MYQTNFNHDLFFTEGSSSSEIPHLWILGVHHLSLSYVNSIWHTYLRHVSWNPADWNAPPLSSLSGVCLPQKVKRCRTLVQAGRRLTRLLGTFINRGAWNVIPSLVHSSGLACFKVLFVFFLFRLLECFPPPVPLKPKLTPTCNGTGGMFS